MQQPAARVAVVFAALNITCHAAFACAFCHSATGAEVRAAIFGGDFWRNILELLSPFAVFAAVVLRMQYGRLWRCSRGSTRKRQGMHRETCEHTAGTPRESDHAC